MQTTAWSQNFSSTCERFRNESVWSEYKPLAPGPVPCASCYTFSPRPRGVSRRRLGGKERHPDSQFTAQRSSCQHVYTQGKGFFTRAGLLVTIERGRGSGHSVRAALKCQEAFTVGELATVLEARTQGLDVYDVASMMERYPGMLIALGGTQRE